MAQMSYFVVQPFEVGGRGQILRCPPVQAQNAGHAERLAMRLAERGGAIAFSRTGDPQLGEFSDAEVLGCWGQVPDEALAA